MPVEIEGHTVLHKMEVVQREIATTVQQQFQITTNRIKNEPRNLLLSSTIFAKIMNLKSLP